MAGFRFTCSQPDFSIKTLPDGTVYKVNKAKMAAGSSIFNGMFSVCEDGVAERGPSPSQPQEMEVQERPEIFGLLLALLHEQPHEGAENSKSRKTDGVRRRRAPAAPETSTDPSSDPWSSSSDDDPFQPHHSTILPPIIPLPILIPLFELLDKYDVSPWCHSIVQNHLKLNAPQNALQVYSLAHQLDLIPIASYASQFLLSSPLESYTLADVETQFPSLAAYHRLTLLHAHRKAKLREVLKGEAIFPHGYGLCTKHEARTKAQWAQRKMEIEPSITASTDLPSEMEVVVNTWSDCAMCQLAGKRALDMLQYKVNKVAYTFGRVPGAM